MILEALPEPYLWSLRHSLSPICDPWGTPWALFVILEALPEPYLWSLRHSLSPICDPWGTPWALFVILEALPEPYLWSLRHPLSAICDPWGTPWALFVILEAPPERWALFVILEALPEPYSWTLTLNLEVHPKPFLWHKCGIIRDTLWEGNHNPDQTCEERRREFQLHIYIYINNLQLLTRPSTLQQLIWIVYPSNLARSQPCWSYE